ncbi:MAG: hypothetical protein K2L96_05255 [Muribaculaceae bacterium]|nr:hypothetical protein [Muribaculaceae bacterium]
MSKNKIIGFACGLSLFAAGACNSTYEPGESIASSAAVYSFSVRSAAGDLKGVDTVFFSVDIIGAKIFNADSLPYGTRVSALIPSVKTLDGVSVCEFIVPRAGMTDTIINLISHPSDSVDFSHGPVTLRIVSPDALVERRYSVQVNVHQMKSDSLEWALTQRSPLPGGLANAVCAGTAVSGGKMFCASADASGNYALCKSSDPYLTGAWESVQQAFDGLSVDPTSLRGGESTLYILGTTGRLYTSTDEGASWSDSGRDYCEMFGEMNGYPVGTALDAAGKYVLVNGETGATESLPSDDFPVQGATAGVKYRFPMSMGSQMVIAGGRTPSGELSRDAWTFDGQNWMKVTGLRQIPEGLEGMAMVAYTTFEENDAWDADRYPSLLLFGGRDKTGVPQKTVYVSRDYGMSWNKASELLQLPDYFPACSFMSGHVFNHMTKADDASAAMLRAFAPYSRATEPVHEWEVPYIYLTGGTCADGTLNAYIWRGVINRLSFKPLI